VLFRAEELFDFGATKAEPGLYFFMVDTFSVFSGVYLAPLSGEVFSLIGDLSGEIDV
jgi:hypothetical protein